MQNNFFLSSNLKYLRERKEKTQEDIAKVIEKQNTTISNYEKGIREPDAIDLIKLANYFCVSVDDLMSKDLSIKNNVSFDELEILFSKNKDLLTDEDKEYIRFIIEKRKREIDKELGENDI